MAQENIKQYILEYKNNYSKEQIIQSLQDAGYKIEDINIVYSQFSQSHPSAPSKKKNSHKTLIVILILVFLGIPVLFLVSSAFFYSSVDFGTLLPNKFDISTQSIKGDVLNSYIDSNDNSITMAFTYTGSQKGLINPSNSILTMSGGESCTPLKVLNTLSTNDSDSDISFLSGHMGEVVFDCQNLNLKSGEQVEGKIKIGVIDPKSPSLRVMPNEGTFRLTVE
jgi:hypothetical protein